MKTRTFLALGLALTTVCSLDAQTSQPTPNATAGKAAAAESRVNLTTIGLNYLSSLQSENTGVVESALGHVTVLRIAFPQLDLKAVQLELYDLASRGATRAIREKAFTAMQVFANPTAFRTAIIGRETNGDGLLEDVSAALQERSGWSAKMQMP